MKVKDGDILVFRGVCWDDGWEFDAPLVIYEPIPRICETGSISPVAIVDKVNDICLDLCLGDDLPTQWSEGTKKELKWRGWSPRGFKRRGNGCHAEVVVKFTMDIDYYPPEMCADVIAAAEIDIRTGKRTPILEGVPAEVSK
jgi:hypothetical protein